MVLTIRYHAAARELAALSEERVEYPASSAATAGELLSRIAERHPRLTGYASRMRLAINGELADPGDAVKDGDEIDVLPPVAGGSGTPEAHVAIRDTPLSIDECFRAVMRPGAGGVAVFVGVVRNQAQGHPVARLDYEAHPVLADKELRRMVLAIQEELPDVRLAVTHRVGSLKVGDLAVVIAASAPHRAQAFDACRAAIERIKETVPIWKKEWAPDGSAVWVNLEGG